MFHFHKHRRLNLKKTTELSLSRLILSLGLAGIDTIWALYMSLFGFSDSFIGFVSAFLVIISLLFSIYSTVILEVIGEYKILLFSLIITVFSYFSIAFFNNIYVFLIFSIVLTISAILRLESFDILFRDESKRKDLNESEGLMYAMSNFGWFLGPLIAGYILATSGIITVFISSGLFVILGFIILLKMDIKIPKKRENIDRNIFQNLKDYISNKKLFLPYCVSSGVELWWALIYIYMPLFIIQNGLGFQVVGIFLALAVLPLFLFEFEVGKLSQKIGFKKLISIGFFMLSFFSFISFYLNDIYLILGMLILASFPMALIEPLQDSFFFKQIKRKNDEDKFFPIYTTATDFGSFIGKFSVAGIILFFSNSYAYLVIGIFMLIIGFLSLKIKN